VPDGLSAWKCLAGFPLDTGAGVCYIVSQ
jgi:hypothetical protein